MSRLPFINTFIEKFKKVDKIDKLIEENKCDSIPYSKIDCCTDIDDYDFIIIIGYDELDEAYDKYFESPYRHKLYFIGNYNCIEYHNILIDEIRSSININYMKKYKNNILINNLTQFISISNGTNVKNNKDMEWSLFWTYSLCSNLNNIFHYIVSSVKQLHVVIGNYFTFDAKNLPNKIKILNCDCYGLKPIKLSINTICILNVTKLLFDKRIPKLNELKKLKQTLILNIFNTEPENIGRYEAKLESGNSFYFIKNNNKFKLINVFYSYNFILKNDMCRDVKFFDNVSICQCYLKNNIEFDTTIIYIIILHMTTLNLHTQFSFYGYGGTRELRLYYKSYPNTQVLCEIESFDVGIINKKLDYYKSLL